MNLPQKILLMLLLLLAGLLSACGGGGGGPGPGPGPSPKITLSGRAVDEAGQPLPAASVLLGLVSQTADAGGNFAFPSLTAGDYTISVQGAGGEFGCRTVSLSESSSSFDIPAEPTGSFGVLEIQPQLGQTAGSLDQQIFLVCSNTVDAATVSAEDFTFTPDIGSFDVAVASANVSLQPRRQLPLGQFLVLQYTGSISSEGGANLDKPMRFAFRTPAVDNAAPRLVSTQPSDGDSDYPTNLSLRFEFNEKLGALTDTWSAQAAPPVELAMRVSGSTLIVTPVGGWAVTTGYTVTVSGVSDLLGNSIAAPIALSFTSGTAAAPSHNVSPAWNRVLNRIVFASDQLGSYDIYSIKDDGTELVALTTEPGDELHPSLSADGLLLAYQALGEDGDWDVFVGSADASAPALAVTGGPFNDTQPTFSRTFSRNIFFVTDRSNPQSIFMMGEDGSSPASLDTLFNSTQSEPAPHPLLDTQLLFTSARSGSADIWRKTISVVDGSSANTNLTNDLIPQDHSPDWSADASFFVYVSDKNGASDLWLGDLGSGLPRQVTNLASTVADPVISPFVGDARCVVSLPSETGGSDLFIIELVGGSIVQQLTGEGI